MSELRSASEGFANMALSRITGARGTARGPQRAGRGSRGADAPRPDPAFRGLAHRGRRTSRWRRPARVAMTILGAREPEKLKKRVVVNSFCDHCGKLKPVEQV